VAALGGAQEDNDIDASAKRQPRPTTVAPIIHENVGIVESLPDSFLDPCGFPRVVVGRWRAGARHGIHDKEVRSALFRLARESRSHHSYNSVLLPFEDNMSELLALGRGQTRRGESFNLVQCGSSPQIATNSRWGRRLVQTDMNLSDRDSRRRLKEFGWFDAVRPRTPCRSSGQPGRFDADLLIFLEGNVGRLLPLLFLNIPEVLAAPEAFVATTTTLAVPKASVAGPEQPLQRTARSCCQPGRFSRQP
jgi:hypothetical protein